MQKKEIVFMPYKASMWDSLESIWRAAAQDPECEAFVIPIPFYTIVKDKNEKVFNYEGKMFPSYVPITNYKNYDLAKRKPYAVYIHNAYDDCNTLTQVLPDYFTQNLKKHSKNLVYVPYYIANENSSEHFSQLPGLKNVDYIIAANEKGCEKFKKNNLGKRVLGLGSPKADAIINMNKYPPSIPQEWKDRCAGKKTVFYNISVSTLLNSGMQGLEKIEETLQYFSDRENVEVIWRPHPLSEETAASVNEDLHKKYLNIVENFKQNNMGIYDDTPDFHAAFALSDMYYGHGSSLSALYGLMGKPVMIQNSADGNPFSFFFFNGSSLLEGKTIWVSAWYFNALFKVELGKTDAEFLGHFPNEPLHAGVLYRSPVRIGNKLIFAPIYYTGKVAIYDTETKEFSSVELPKTEEEVPSDQRKFIDAFAYKNRVFMVGYEYGGIACLDIDSLECRVLAGGKKYNYSCVDENCLLAPVRETNKILQLNMESLEETIVEMPSKHEFWLKSGAVAGEIFLIPINGKPIQPIIKWNRKDNAFKEFGNYPQGFKPEANGGHRFTSWGFACGYMWLFCVQQTGATFIRLNTETGEMTSFAIPRETTEHPYFICEYGKSFLMQFNPSNETFVVLCENEVKPVPLSIQIPENFPILEYAKEIFSNSISWAAPELAFSRSEFYPVCLMEYLLDNLDSAKELSSKQIEAFSSGFANSDGTAGEKIHKAVMEGVHK